MFFRDWFSCWREMTASRIFFFSFLSFSSLSVFFSSNKANWVFFFSNCRWRSRKIYRSAEVGIATQAQWLEQTQSLKREMRKSVCACVCVCERECVCVRACACERERVCVCVRARVWEWESVCISVRMKEE